MYIRIYQIDKQKDKDKVKFIDLDRLKNFQKDSAVNSKIYKKVFEGRVSCKRLEAVYIKFNLDYPDDFKGHSLSVSDVVEVVTSDTVEKGFYFCDSMGFKKIEFNFIEREGIKMENKNLISVLLLEPNKYPKMIEIENTLESMQKIVGGYIEEYMPFDDDVAIVCNEEGKLKGEQLNRAIYDKDNKIIDIIAGKFFICNAPIDSEKFESLPKDLADKYAQKFKYPEKFYEDINGDVKAKSYKPMKKDMER